MSNFILNQTLKRSSLSIALVSYICRYIHTRKPLPPYVIPLKFKDTTRKKIPQFHLLVKRGPNLLPFAHTCDSKTNTLVFRYWEWLLLIRLYWILSSNSTRQQFPYGHLDRKIIDFIWHQHTTMSTDHYPFLCDRYRLSRTQVSCRRSFAHKKSRYEIRVKNAFSMEEPLKNPYA